MRKPKDVDLRPLLGNWDVDPELPLEAIKKAHVLSAYEHFDRCRAATARSLGVDGKTLYNWLTAWGAPPAAKVTGQRLAVFEAARARSRNETESKSDA